MKKVLFILLTILAINDIRAQQKVELIFNVGDYSNLLSISPDGKFAATNGAWNDGYIKIWDIQSGRLIKTLSGHSGYLTSLIFSPNSKLLISASIDKTIIVWDIYSGEKIHTMKSKEDWAQSSVSFSPDSKYAVSRDYSTSSGRFDDGDIILWDINNGKEISISGEEHKSAICLTYSPNGRYVFSGGIGWDNSILYNASNLTKITDFDTINRLPSVYSASFTSDSKYILTGDKDNIIKLWDIQTLKPIKTFKGHKAKISFISSSSDNRYFISFEKDSSKLLIWDVDSEKLLKTMRARAAQFIPGTNKLLYLDGFYEFCTLDIPTGSFRKTGKEIKKPITKFASYSPDGKYILQSNNNYPILWNLESKTVLRVFNGHNDQKGAQAFSPDGNFVLTSNGSNLCKMWQVSSLTEVMEFNKTDGLYSLAFSPDGNYFISDRLNLIEVKTGNLIKKFLETGTSFSVAFSPDSKSFISGGGYPNGEPLLKLYNINSENEILSFIEYKGRKRFSNNGIKSVAFTPDGNYILSGDEDNYLKLWDVKTGLAIRTFIGHTGDVNTVSISNDGKLAVSGSEDNTIKIWEINTGKEIKTLTGHSLSILSASFSPDNKFILSSSNDGFMKIWDVVTGKCLITCWAACTGDIMNNWVCFAPDGRFDGTPTAINYFHFVKDMEIIPLENLYENYYTPNLLSRVLNGELVESFIKVDDLKPKPYVKITSPTSATNGFILQNSILQSDQQAIDVTLQVTDMGGGIDEILLFHNDKLVETTNRGFKPLIENNAIKTKSFSVILIDGENKIKATAFNNERTEAIPCEIIVNYKSPKQTIPSLYLVAIGINEYKNSKYNLNYSIADADSFRKQFESGASTIFDSVHITFIENSDATKLYINEVLEKFRKTIKREDIFIFYYAGHGVMSEEQQPVFFIIPSDVTQMYNSQQLKERGISATELKQLSKEIKAQKQVFILDACQSGGIENEVAKRGAVEEKAIAQLARSTGTYWLAASNSDQFAGEFTDIGHGIFTYCILLGLSGEADAQKDKKVTVQELSTYLSEQVPILSKQYKGNEQYPNTYGFGQDFPIIIVK